ncbi:MAG: hypothetical protein IPJ65_16630 [Archangiaceae bacterium]|nr:hypothetical protein [Archangiaceae bacterium]
MRSYLMLIAAVALAACGSPAPGGACDTSGFLCSDQTTAMECQLQKWVALPCRGPSGCQRDSNVIKCDMSGNMEGDACASSAVGSGLCTGDGKATLECRHDDSSGTNTLKKTNTCRSCEVKRNTTTGKDEVVCTP